jgi:hypothetical protein
MLCENYTLSANGNDTICLRPAIGTMRAMAGSETLPLNVCVECAEDIQQERRPAHVGGIIVRKANAKTGIREIV